jgi:hypothetical protein
MANCPDCHPDGGDGKRCTIHKLEHIRYEMRNLLRQLEEAHKEIIYGYDKRPKSDGGWN